MTVEIKVDSANVSYVQAGMRCDIVQYDMTGRPDHRARHRDQSVSLEGKNENGVSYFPATIQVENPDGELRPGMYVEYCMTASQADDCLSGAAAGRQADPAGYLRLCGRRARTANALDPGGAGHGGPGGLLCRGGDHRLVRPEPTWRSRRAWRKARTIFVQYMTNEGSSWDMGGGMSGGVIAVG